MIKILARNWKKWHMIIMEDSLLKKETLISMLKEWEYRVKDWDNQERCLDNSFKCLFEIEIT